MGETTHSYFYQKWTQSDKGKINFYGIKKSFCFEFQGENLLLLQTNDKLIKCRLGRSSDLAVENHIEVEQNLRNIHLVGGILFIVYDKSLDFVKTDSLTLLSKLNFNEDILGYFNVDSNVFDFSGVLSINGTAKSTHLFMKEAVVVATMEVEGITSNVFVNKEGLFNQSTFIL